MVARGDARGSLSGSWTVLKQAEAVVQWGEATMKDCRRVLPRGSTRWQETSKRPSVQEMAGPKETSLMPGES